MDLKKLSDVVSTEVVKKTVYIKLNMNINNLEKRIPDAAILIHINQFNTDKQSLEEKRGDVNNGNVEKRGC